MAILGSDVVLQSPAAELRTPGAFLFPCVFDSFMRALPTTVLDVETGATILKLDADRNFSGHPELIRQVQGFIARMVEHFKEYHSQLLAEERSRQPTARARGNLVQSEPQAPEEREATPPRQQQVTPAVTNEDKAPARPPAGQPQEQARQAKPETAVPSESEPLPGGEPGRDELSDQEEPSQPKGPGTALAGPPSRRRGRR